MTRRDYVRLADALVCGSRAARLDPNVAETIASHVADALAGTNPRFSRERFLTAAQRPMVEGDRELGS